MSDQHLDRMRQRLTVPAPPPPADLAAKIKADIPDLSKKRTAEGASLSDHPAMWRLAASIIMIFGFSYIAARSYMNLRTEKAFAARMRGDQPQAVAHSASDERLRDGALAEPPAAPQPLVAAKESAAPDNQLSLADRRDRDIQESVSGGVVGGVEGGVMHDQSTGNSAAAARPAPATAQAEDDESFAFSREPEVMADLEKKNESTRLAASAPPPPPAAAAPAGATAAAGPEEVARVAPPVATQATAESRAPQPSRAKVAFRTETSSDAAAAPAPRAISRKMPNLSSWRRQSGTFVAEVTVDAAGAVSTVRLVSGISRDVDRAFITAMQQWRYEAAAADRQGAARTFTERICVKRGKVVTCE